LHVAQLGQRQRHGRLGALDRPGLAVHPDVVAPGAAVAAAKGKGVDGGTMWLLLVEYGMTQPRDHMSCQRTADWDIRLQQVSRVTRLKVDDPTLGAVRLTSH
jgi:hypothetical protein